MANEGIRVGLIGAGRNTRDRHIPGFHQVDGVGEHHWFRGSNPSLR